jgi:hypothetical protein
MRISKRLIIGALMFAGLAGGVAGRLSRRARTSAPRPLVSAAPAVPSARALKPLRAAESIFDSKLGAGWQDLGWGRHDLSVPGPARIEFGGYGGIVFYHQELKAHFGGVAFRFRAPAAWAPFLSVSLRHAHEVEASFPKVDLKPADLADAGDGWLEAWVAWSRLNPRHLPMDRLVIAASRPVATDWVLVDKVILTAPNAADADIPVRDAVLSILCDQEAQHISPMIYGFTHGAWDNGGTVQRIGGNPTSRLNWDIGAWNAGKDWFFENTAGEGTVWQWVEEGTAHRVRSQVTVPLLGWVAKDVRSVGFPVAKFGKQRAQDPYRSGAGDGYAPDGTKIKPGPPGETSIAAPPEKIAAWVASLRERDISRGSRSISAYILDNEPSLWNETHRDVHPDPVSQDELLDRTIRYATAIRHADPDIPIAGPAEWGWTGYLYSAKDREVGTDLRPDRRLHGDVPLIAWYLQQLAAHEQRTHTRLLDVLDLHFYPQAERIFGTNARTDPQGSALRIRSTRSLWDPKYVDESWIADAIQLIPRMREWVAKNYPGLKLSIGEWSFGADEHMSGALAVAEVLGRFGQQGLDSAFYWGGPKRGLRTFWAFRAYRNFDGAGGHFLDWSIPTHEVENLSFFASRDDSGAHVVAIMVNLDPSFAIRARVDTLSCGKLTRARGFAYGPESEEITPEPAKTAIDDLVELIPPYSIRVLDLSFVPPGTAAAPE